MAFTQYSTAVYVAQIFLPLHIEPDAAICIPLCLFFLPASCICPVASPPGIRRTSLRASLFVSHPAFFHRFSFLSLSFCSSPFFFFIFLSELPTSPDQRRFQPQNIPHVRRNVVMYSKNMRNSIDRVCLSFFQFRK